MRNTLILLGGMTMFSLIMFSCNAGADESSSQQPGEDTTLATDQSPRVTDRPEPAHPKTSYEGRHAPMRANSKASFKLIEESEADYQAALNKRVIYSFKDTDGYKQMKQHKDLCWGIPLAKNTLKNYCPNDEDQYKLDYIGRWEDRDALVFEAGITGFHPLTNLVELESGWEIELEGYLHISPGSRWVAGIANEPLIWVGMYIYDAQSLNMDRVFEVGEPDGGYADAFHSFNVSSPVWVSDQELHLWEDLPNSGERKYYVLQIEE